MGATMRTGAGRRVVMAVLAGVLLPLAALAGQKDLAAQLDETDPFELQATIMEVNSWNKYLIVAEKKVELVDFRKGGKRYKTMVRDWKGNTIRLEQLEKGQWVFIRAYKLVDGTIAAREVYRLPGIVRNRKSFSFFQKVPPWQHVR